MDRNIVWTDRKGQAQWIEEFKVNKSTDWMDGRYKQINKLDG